MRERERHYATSNECEREAQASSHRRFIFFCRLFLFVPLFGFRYAIVRWLLLGGFWRGLVEELGKKAVSCINRNREADRVANLRDTWHPFFPFWIRSKRIWSPKHTDTRKYPEHVQPLCNLLKDCIEYAVRLCIYLSTWQHLPSFFHIPVVYRKCTRTCGVKGLLFIS